jgi:hypothetical protein
VEESDEIPEYFVRGSRRLFEHRLKTVAGVRQRLRGRFTRVLGDHLDHLGRLRCIAGDIGQLRGHDDVCSFVDRSLRVVRGIKSRHRFAS